MFVLKVKKMVQFHSTIVRVTLVTVYQQRRKSRKMNIRSKAKFHKTGAFNRSAIPPKDVILPRGGTKINAELAEGQGFEPWKGY